MIKEINEIPFSQEIVKEIIRLHDEEYMSISKIAKQLHLSLAKLLKCTKSGLIRFKKTKDELLQKRATGVKVSEETKKKISESRKKYIALHPDSMPYKKYHYTNGESYAEKYFREWMEKENIPFIAQQQLYIYTLDFVIGSIDLEIDGEQHYHDNRIIESDKRRTEYIESQGFKVIRIRWADYKKLSQEEQHEYLERLKITLTTDNKLNDNFVINEGKLKKVYGKCQYCGGDILSKWNKKFCSSECTNLYHLLPALNKLNNKGNKKELISNFIKQLIEELKTTSANKLSKKYNVSHTTIKRWIDKAKQRGII